jgi:hypothetical protein
LALAGPLQDVAEMRAFLSTLGLALILTIAWTPARLSAVTVDEIVSLSKAGVSEAVILALLDRDRTVLSIDPDRLVALKREGLSDTLILAMLRNGRQEGDDAARAVAAERAADVLASLSSTPQVTIVGHGPERPNTAHTEDLYAGIRDGVRLPAAIPYGSPYAIPYPSVFSYAPAYGAPYARPFKSRPQTPYRDRVLCLAQVNTARGAGPSYITECPAVMQRSVPPR